ncbi:MAG: 1,4-alpha-glucan branching protein GlgB [Bacilli bacterium]|nr:1,4-alpha-glucan branching protein GlgB [Bacilli bacterium]
MKQFINAFHTTYATDAYRYLGSHYENPLRSSLVTFRVYAPHANEVHVVGDFNKWNPTSNPMKQIEGGLWEATIDSIPPFANYKYAITSLGKTFLKQDPYANHFETNGKTSSKVYPLMPYPYQDTIRPHSPHDPMNIYEVHFSSWRRHEHSYYSYQNLADELIPYAKEMGYTHLEIMPIMEYPFDGSWGYQVTGYFGITSRYGTFDDFRAFVHRAHEAGIGIILDWVPAHFAKDAFGLIEYDGTYLYEDPDPNRREHEGWGTRIFNFAAPEVKSFLISSALFFFEYCHVDGLRVDAVASMLYLDYDRKKWKPNRYGSNLNLEAITFLKDLNQTVHRLFPDRMMIAEESTSFPKITVPVHEGGLGFHYKWNMGWMNDTLAYFVTNPLFRSHQHEKLMFSMMYAFSEHYVLPLSHDEVVHGKKSLIGKMPGEYNEQFAGLRLLAGYQIVHPGKKLTFMGNEFAQFIEWNYNQGLDWLLLLYPTHKAHQDYIKALNHLYLKENALWEQDDSWNGFSWVLSKPNDNLLITKRVGSYGNALLIIMNFSGNNYNDYRFGLDQGKYKLLLNSDDAIFGGQGIPLHDFDTEMVSCDGVSSSGVLNIPRLSILIYSKRKE